MNRYQQCWWEQAASDHGILILFRHQGVGICHQLHYLQMATEKLSKAYLWRNAKPIKKSHAGFGLFMRLLTQISQISQQEKLAEIFSFGRFEDFQNWVRSALPLVYEVERLAPSLANEGPNPEYPWPSAKPAVSPIKYEFTVWQQLTESATGRQLMSIISKAINRFPQYA